MYAGPIRYSFLQFDYRVDFSNFCLLTTIEFVALLLSLSPHQDRMVGVDVTQGPSYSSLADPMGRMAKELNVCLSLSRPVCHVMGLHGPQCCSFVVGFAVSFFFKSCTLG